MTGRNTPRKSSPRRVSREPRAFRVLGRWWSGKSPLVWFSIKFCLGLGLSYAVLAIPCCQHFTEALSVWYAQLSSVVLNLMGEHTHALGATISSQRFAITVIPACAGLEFTQGFCALVLAFPARLSWKVAGIAAGVTFFPALNLLRITSLFLIGLHFPDAFTAAHERVWGTLLIAATLVLSFLWIRWAAQLPRSQPDAVAV